MKVNKKEFEPFYFENEDGAITIFDIGEDLSLQNQSLRTLFGADLSRDFRDVGEMIVLREKSCLPIFLVVDKLPKSHYLKQFLDKLRDTYNSLPRFFERFCPCCSESYLFKRIGRTILVDNRQYISPPFFFECVGVDCNAYLQMSTDWHSDRCRDVKRSSFFMLHEAHALSMPYICHCNQEMALLLSGDVEQNPGPVMSKLFSPSDLWRREYVQSQAFGDLWDVPSNISSLARDFTTFVSKIPDKEFLYAAYADMNYKMSSIIDVLSDTAEKLFKSLDTVAHASQVFKQIVVGVLVIIAFHMLAVNFGWKGVVATIVTSFLLHHFGILDCIKNIVLDNSMNILDYIKKKFCVETADIVPLQGFGGAFADILAHSDNLSALLATLFTVVFVSSVKMSPTTRDMEDLSRKIFNYQRGATSVLASFDKLKEFWVFTIDMIGAKLQLKSDETVVNTYTVYRKVDDWIQRNTELFKSGFSHTLTMDQKKKKLELLRTLYNEGLDMAALCTKLDRTKNLIVTFWNNKLHTKISEMSTEALEGSMRNAPATILLYGSSGAGKSSLVTALASFTSRLHATLTGTEQPSSASVYVRNCDQAHYDGYTNQFALIIDDFLSRKDTEANPNLEPNELIKIKNTIPYPLPMAHLPDKGRFLNSEVVIATTNVKNVSSALPSMNFPYAVANRLSDLSFAVRVRPEYRKFISNSQREYLISKGLSDQHSVDPVRARYLIDPILKSKMRDISLGESDLLNTYSDEEFLRMRGDERRLPNGDIQYMNYDLYYFQRLDIKTGELSGPYLDWSEFLTEIERVYTARISIGEKILQQSEWTHGTSLAHMKAGIIDVPGYVISQMNRADFVEALEQGEFHDALDDDKQFAVQWGIANYDLMLQPRYFELHQTYLSYKARWPDYDELVRPTGQEEQEVTNMWNRMFKDCKDKYDQLVAFVNRTDIMEFLSGVFLVFVGVSSVAVSYYTLKNFRQWRNQPHIQDAIDFCEQEKKKINSKRSWLQRLFSPTLITVSRKDIPLTARDIYTLFANYGYDIVLSEAAQMANSGSSNNSVRSQRSGGRGSYSTFVPSHAFDVDKVRELAEEFGVKSENYEEGLRVYMSEHELPAFCVQLQGCQLTDQFLDYVLPANSFMLRIWSNSRKQKYDFGNVFFIEDRKFLMPNHYMMMLKYQMRKGNLSENDIVSFIRGPTTLERKNKRCPNKIQCRVVDLLDYAQIISPAHVDDKTPMPKDAIVVNVTNMSGHSCSNMVNKFISRSEFAKLNCPGLSGYLIAQRFSDDGTDSCYCSPIPCVDVTPVNKFKYMNAGNVAKESNDLVGLASAGPADCPVYFQSVIRDRYNYKADTRQGDCGAVLFIESNSLQHPLVGIHVAGDKQQGRANSVPITQEDIREAISRLQCCESQGFLQPELEPLDIEDVQGIISNVPQGDFHYVGKLTGKVPIQPLKTVIKPSEAQTHLNVLEDSYRMKKGKSYRLEIKKKPAHLRVDFQNPPDCRIYYGKKGSLMYQHNDFIAPLTQSTFNVWLAKGGKFNDVLMKGLEKTSLQLPYIDPKKIDRAIYATKQKFFRRGPNSTCPYEKAVSQNVENLSPLHLEELGEYAKRMRNITEIISCVKDMTNKDLYEAVLRKMTLIREEHNVFQSNLDLDNEVFRDEVLYQLNALTVSSTSKLYYDTMPNPMLLTIEQAVMGIPSDPTISSINSKKSPGYPYTSRGLNFGKKPWVGKECKCDGELWPELLKDVNDLKEACKQGIPPVYFVATLKDELRPIEKVDQFKTRVFCAGPMHFTILFRMYFMRFLSFVMENRLYNESALGINPYSLEWEQLADHLNYWDGPYCIAGDYSNFDGSLSNQIMEKILGIVLDFYAQYGTNEEEQLIRRNLWMCLTRSMVIGRNGCVFRLFNSQPSGNPYTTLINILFNSVVFRMAYADIFAKQTLVKRDIYDFDKDVHFISYGDDNVANINPEIIHIFNMQSISEALAVYGLTYTDETKQGTLVRARRIDEIGFLKRGFRRVNELSRRWVAPLDIETVKEMVMWVRRSDEDMKKKILQDVLDVSLREMVLHGPKEYDEWCTFVQGFEDNRLLGKDMIMIPDYETQFIRTCNEDLDPDPSF